MAPRPLRFVLPAISSLLLLEGCGCGNDPAVISGVLNVTIGDFGLGWRTWGDLQLGVHWQGQSLLRLDDLAFGTGEATIQHQVGSYRFNDVGNELADVTGLGEPAWEEGALLIPLLTRSGEQIGELRAIEEGEGVLRLSARFEQEGLDRAHARFSCTAEESFLGAGGHAFDVSHSGEAFALWVSEPGIGKVPEEEYPEAWYLTGTRHAASYPVPFLLRPQVPMGLSIDTLSRVEFDLCASDPDHWSITAWEGRLDLLIFAGETPLDVVEEHALFAGPPLVPPDWAFAPWLDAIRGEARVREVARTLREAGAPASIIWTEDWKGAEETGFGYKLLDEWFLDETLYPDATGLDAELEAQGFKWLAYFAPFLSEGTETARIAAEHAIRHPETGEVYWMTGSDLHQTTVLDVSNPEAIAWAQDAMQQALEIGFDGWMTDFGEWLPPDAVLHDLDPLAEHNLYPLLWQELNAEVIENHDAVIFTRSGWTGTGGLSAVTWAGDQRTSFETDDGYPTVIPMGIGTSLSGSPFFGHDIAGYASIGNAPSDKELWFRWCSLGAFSPIMRTHHGRFDLDNWQFDSDAETLAHFTRYAAEHTRLFPYLRGLAERAATEGTPLILPPAMLHGGDWGRIDAWLLGPSLLVAPVLEAGASGRQVELPSNVGWYDWWTGEPVSSGWFEAGAGEIPVFVPEGSIVPTFSEVPDTLAPATAEGLVTLAEADRSRTVYVFGRDGIFVEADGTRYAASGSSTASGERTVSLRSGNIEVEGLTLEISGEVERSYRVVVVP